VTIAVAHRAGNRLEWLRRAEAAHAEYAETDVWLERDAVTVRHPARLGPPPLLHERWRLSLALGAPSLAALLRALAPETRLLLDLKGADVRLSLVVRELLAARAPGCGYAVCSQVWLLLEPFADVAEAAVWHSVGAWRRWRQYAARWGTAYARRLASTIACSRLGAWPRCASSRRRWWRGP